MSSQLDNFLEKLQLDKPVEVGKRREPHISQKIATAKKSGYSDDQILEFLSEKDPRVSQALEAGHKPNEVLSFLSKQKAFGNEGWLAGGMFGRGVESTLEDPLLPLKEAGVAALRTAEGLSHLMGPAALQPPGIPGLPGSNDTNFLSNALQEKISEGLPEHLRQGAEDIADIESFLLPIPGLKGAKTLPGAKKASGGISKMIREREALTRVGQAAEKWVPDTFESGLTKPGAVGAKNARFGTISKGQQEQAIGKLEAEAQELMKSKVAEKAPITKKIQEGFDFKKYHREEFGRLRALAKRANPDIDTTPLNKFFRDEAENLRGIVSPSPEKVKIKKEIALFNRNPKSFLYDLLKNRRNNSAKMDTIYDKRLMHGTQQEYVDFLNRMNKKIDESIFITLPEDSQWVKQYKKMNAEFGEFKRGQDVIKILEPILREKMNTSALTRLAENPDKQKYLRIKMGEEAANEVIQIAKDLKEAQRAVKRISVKDFNKFDTTYPISWLFKPLGVGMTVKKGYDLSRKMYGHLLLSPSKRKAFDQLLEAVIENDLPAYTKAAHKLDPHIEALAKQNIAKNLQAGSEASPVVKEKTLEINPEFKKIQQLDEPTNYLRSRDLNGRSSNHIIFKEKEWKKYFNPDLYEKYNLVPSPEARDLGKFGDLIKDPRLRKHFKEILDVEVKIDPFIIGQGNHSSSYNKSDRKYLIEFISVKPELTPQNLHSTLIHEGTHALQARRINKKTGHPRLIERLPKEPYASYEEYLKNLNEVNARKFQNWVDLPVNKYRSALEKSKYAQKLLQSQK